MSSHTKTEPGSQMPMDVDDTSYNLCESQCQGSILAPRSENPHGGEPIRIPSPRYFARRAEETSTQDQSRIDELKNELEYKTKRYERMNGLFQTLVKYSSTFKRLVVFKTSNTEVAMQRKAALDENRTVIGKLQRRIEVEEEERKKNHNEIQDLKGQIRVYCRVRPLLDGHDYEDGESALRIPTSTKITLLSPTTLAQNRQESREFAFHHVFPPKTRQQEVFESVKSLVQSVVDEYNVCTLAYGNGGSGKTHTILGSSESPGVARRAIQELFYIKAKQEGNLFFDISCSIIEMRLNQLRDLLSSRAKKTAIVDFKLGSRDLETTSAERYRLTSERDFLNLLENAIEKRHHAVTNTNNVSSRSHMITSIIVKTTDIKSQKYWIGKLSFVDLAGMESQKMVSQEAAQLEDAWANNKSFRCLHEVIRQVAEGVDNPSYSSSKLTRLLKEYLGGDSKTVMFVNISPCSKDYLETKSSLSYARDTGVIKRDEASCFMDEEAARLRERIKKWEQNKDISRIIKQFH